MNFLTQKLTTIFHLFVKNNKPQIMQPKTKTIYIPVDHHIYDNGSSFRVRLKKNGKTISKNFINKKYALTFRDTMINELKKK